MDSSTPSNMAYQPVEERRRSKPGLPQMPDYSKKLSFNDFDLVDVSTDW